MNYTSLTSRLALGCVALFCGACELNVTVPDGSGGSGSGGSTPIECEPDSAISCWEGCEGYQLCSPDGQWGECQCYDGVGGTPGAGGGYGVGGYGVGGYGVGGYYPGTGGYDPGCGVGGTGGGVGGFPSGTPLMPVDGWLDVASNSLGMQGAIYAYASDTTLLFEDFSGSNACIAGLAPQVQLDCDVVPPYTDCYGMYWGAAIGLNLNQPIDPVTGQGVEPMPFDASGLSGFYFEVNGPTVPSSMRFLTRDASGQEFCTPVVVPILPGPNYINFADLLNNCWDPALGGAQPDPSNISQIAWQVVTNDSSEVPFDFCVSNIVAVQ